jgi:hypothetical protein
MVIEPTDASGSEHGIALGPYATSIGWILLRLLLQIVAGLIATAAVMALCSLPAVTSSYGFKMMTAEPFGTGVLPTSSTIGYFQWVAEGLFLIFVLIEFARALVRIARRGRP